MTQTSGVSRRELLTRATALVAGATVLDRLPHALRLQGWLEDAYAAGPNVVTQTLNGLVAFIVPGRDRYSRAQGTRSKTPGGIEAGTTAVLTRTLDRFLPGPLPLSATAATILNEFAAQVDPASRKGTFASPFANLSFAKKARVFATIESLSVESAGSIRFLVGNLPDLVAFLAYSEAGVFDANRRRLRARPVGWRLTRYTGVADGRKELKGYWQGRKRPIPVRDVIVVGAGGGGPVVAKELAARGLDVLLLEAGPGVAAQRARVVALRERGEQSGDRRLPLRPRRPHAAAVGARPAAELLPLADGRRRRLDACTTSPTRRARCRALSRTSQADSAEYDRRTSRRSATAS